MIIYLFNGNRIRVHIHVRVHGVHVRGRCGVECGTRNSRDRVHNHNHGRNHDIRGVHGVRDAVHDQCHSRILHGHTHGDRVRIHNRGRIHGMVQH